MTAMIIPFVGRAELQARDNLASYIEHAKTYRFFHAHDAVDWHDNSWNLKPFFSKSSSTPVGLVAHFTTMETTRRGPRAKDAVDLPEPFLAAAKALTTEFLRTSGDNSPAKIVATLRIVEKAFRDLGQIPDICNLTPSVLDRAQEVVIECYADAWTYGRLLERLARDYINPARISKAPLAWRSSIQYQAPKRNDQVNKDGGASGRTDKLPSLNAIWELATVFHNSAYVPDVVVTSWFALAMFAPSRATEILGLPVSCETEMDGRYGLSWRPLKSGDPLTKFATSDESAEVAKLAIRRLLQLGEKSRIAHRWYEQNPTLLYLPAGLEHLRDEPITQWEAAQIIGRSKPIQVSSSVHKALRRCGTTKDLSRGKPGSAGSFLMLYTFESLEKYVLNNLPESFPYIDPRNGVLGSEALFCLPDEIMRGYADTQQYIPRYLTYSQIIHELGSKPTGETVFSRNSLVDPKTGKPWRLTTHQPRHLLNTLAQSKHVSQELIAFWSGRKNVKQNASYNHVPQEAYIEAYVLMDERAPADLKVMGPLANKVEERSRKEVISYGEALKLELGSTISTRFGLCRHDYSLMPCPKDKDCIRCGENTFVKGNHKQLEEARNQLEIHTKAVTEAQNALDRGRFGAERYVKLHSEKASRWAMAIERLTDPNIADRTLITLPPVADPQTRSGLAAAIRTSNIRTEPGSDLSGAPTLDGLLSDGGGF